MQRLAGFMRTYWTRGEPGRPTPRSLQLTMLRFWLLAFVFKILGASWDVSWHFKWLRDDFAPPHLLNTVGTGIAICLVLAHTFTGYGADRRSLRIMQTGTIIFTIAGPIDVINHRINGLDITSWSPSHMLLYLGTAIMIAGVIRNWYVSHPRGGRWSWQYTAGLTVLWTCMFENTFFPNLHQEYGIIAIERWLEGRPTGEPSLLEFAANQIGRPVDDLALSHFALPIPAWVYPVWTIGLCAAMLVFARIMVGRRWTATAVVAIYIGYRTVIWPALTFTIFPSSVVPFWLIGVGLAVDAAFLLPGHAHLRAVVGAVVVTAAGYGAAALQMLVSGTPLRLGAQDMAGMRAMWADGAPLHFPPVSWMSAPWAALALAALWIAVTSGFARTIGPDGSPVGGSAAYAPEPRRTATGVLDGFADPESEADATIAAEH